MKGQWQGGERGREGERGERGGEGERGRGDWIGLDWIGFGENGG